MKKIFLASFILTVFFSVCVFAQENNDQPHNPGTNDNQQAQISSGDNQSNPEVDVQGENSSADNNLKQSESGNNNDPKASEGQQEGENAAPVKKEHPAGKSYYEPTRNHNPMMSPKDYERIRKAEEERLEAEREARLAAERAAELANANNYVPEVKKVDPMKVLERKIKIQAIMGDMAVINGEPYSRGEVIRKTGGAKVKSIGGNYIIVEYKGKTLKKVFKNR